MQISDKGTAADWLQRGHDPEYVAGVLGCSVSAVLRCQKMRPQCCPTPHEIAVLAAEARATRTAADGMRADAGTVA